MLSPLIPLTFVPNNLHRSCDDLTHEPVQSHSTLANFRAGGRTLDSSSIRINSQLKALLPGLLLASSVATAGIGGASLAVNILSIPAMVVALFFGIALHNVANRPLYQPGIDFCVRTVLRCGVALLGFRTAISDIATLGVTTIGVVVASMTVTIASGLLCAWALRQRPAYGVLTGIGTAVCGASAALAAATVLPDYKDKKADIVFVVVALNSLATLAMVLYPPLCAFLGLDERATGIMLGATIHDVGQVVGSAYPISDATGNTAVIVKLFRVFLLFPIVVAAGWWFARGAMLPSAAKIPVPVFALVFVAFALVNSCAPFFSELAPAYTLLKTSAVATANVALLIAIAALGLSTSFTSITTVGWRHLATVSTTTVVILIVTIAGLLMLR